MTDNDKEMLNFADSFEREFIQQGAGRRSIIETLDIGFKLLKQFKLEK
jgi:vacuolar-type H+-ATPase subunit B/Vma2